MAVLVLVVVLSLVLALAAMHAGAFLSRRSLLRGPTLPGNVGVRIEHLDVNAEADPRHAHAAVLALAQRSGATVGFTSAAQIIFAPRVSIIPFDSVVSAWFTPSFDASPDAERVMVHLETRPVAQGIPIDLGHGRRAMAAIADELAGPSAG